MCQRTKDVKDLCHVSTASGTLYESIVTSSDNHNPGKIVCIFQSKKRRENQLVDVSDRAANQRKLPTRMHTLSFFWTILGLFLGLLGGLFPIIIEKSSSISVFNKETENFSFSSLSLSSSSIPLFVAGDSSPGSLHAAPLVLRFHGRAVATAAAVVETDLMVAWSGDGEEGWWECEGRLTHLRNLCWPQRR